jgi:class 3 adenylate cyclase
VNVASRLTGAAPGGKIWIGNKTRELAAGRIAVRTLEPLQVKGREAPVIAYEVVSAAADPSVACFQPKSGGQLLCTEKQPNPQRVITKAAI